MASYVLPELRYDYGALEPHISAEIMKLHHDKHHAAYVKGANETVEQLAEARAKDDYARIAGLERALAFHVSGHVLHSIFWTNLAPKAGGQPQGALLEQLQRDFGGYEKFKAQLVNATMTIMGSGWSALVWEPLGRKLLVTQIYDHQSNLAQAGTPLLVLDAWEHAFYLQYENRKEEYLGAVWNVWNWADVAERFQAARHVSVELVGAGVGVD